MRFTGCTLLVLGLAVSEFESYLLGLARGKLEHSSSAVDIARIHLVQSASMLGIVAGIGMLVVGLLVTIAVQLKSSQPVIFGPPGVSY
jgi:hypothetical protein